MLGARVAEGDYETPADRELIEQRLWRARRTGGDADRFVRCIVGPAERAVGAVDVHVRVAEALEPVRCNRRELRDAFDRIDLAREQSEDRSRVAGAGSD